MPKRVKIKLTPEEKKNLRILKKADKKFKAAERKKQVKRDYLHREIGYGNLTIKKYEQDWRQMLIDISLPNMRKELEFAWHNFEKTIDCKDFQIKLLMEEIRESEEQYMMNLKNHVENIDKEIEMFHNRLEDLDNYYQERLEALECRAEIEVSTIQTSFTDAKFYLKTMLFGLEVIRKRDEDTIGIDYYFKLDEEESKYSTIVERLKGILEQQHLQIWEDTRHFLKNYNNATKDRRHKHSVLKMQDDALQVILEGQSLKIHQSCDLIKKLKQKLIERQRILGERINELTYKYDYYHNAFVFLKNKLVDDRKLDFYQVTQMTVRFNKAMKYLEKLENKGKRILQLCAVCSKLETLEEKISPFPSSEKYVTMCTTLNEDNQLPTAYIESLEFFWQRVGQADACRFSLNEEKMFLKKKNALLKTELHLFCKCVECPDVTSPKTIKTKPINVNVTEASKEVEKYKKHSWVKSTSVQILGIEK